MPLRHLRTAELAASMRAQLDLLLAGLRARLGFDVIFVARVEKGKRCVEALSVRAGYSSDLVVGDVIEVARCPVARGATGTLSVPLSLSNGAVFGFLGGHPGPDSIRAADALALEEAALRMVAALDLLEDCSRSEARLRQIVQSVIGGRRFHAVYQPVRDLLTGEIIYREGLTRLDDGVGTTVPVLLAAAHSVGLGPATELALVREIIAAAPEATNGSGLAVNLSVPALTSPEFADFLEDDAPRGLTVELTEEDLIEDYDRLHDAIDRLRSKGLMLAIDDVGAGYTSLRLVIDLKPEIVKLDRAMATGIDSDRDTRALLRALQGYCTETGTLLVVEGIERPSQRDVLRDIGVRYVQGYLIGEPARRTAP